MNAILFIFCSVLNIGKGLVNLDGENVKQIFGATSFMVEDSVLSDKYRIICWFYLLLDALLSA